MTRSIALIAGACALTLPLAPAAWSQSQDGSITVTAPRAGKWAADGSETETVAHSIKINVSDLDLKTPAGQAAAQARITDAAKKSCDWLDAHYPVVDSAKDCVRGAVDAAMTRARAMGS